MFLRDDTPLCTQFQSLLKAFKSETLSFEALLAGAGCGTPASKRPALMCSTAAEVATVLHAERDPALFALWGAFVPPHHQVQPCRLPPRDACRIDGAPAFSRYGLCCAYAVTVPGSSACFADAARAESTRCSETSAAAARAV